MTVKTPENPLNCGSQNGKAKSRLVAQTGTARPQGRADLRGLAVCLTQGSPEVRPASCRQAEEAPPYPHRRPVPQVLSGRRCCRGRAAQPHAAAPVLHWGTGLASCASSRSPTWTWRTARYSSTRGRAARIATSCSARASPWRFVPTSPPIRRTASSSRPGDAAGSRPGGWSRS